MPKVSFSKDETRAAQQANAAMVVFRLEAWHLPTLPLKGYQDGGLLTPEQATEAATWFMGFMAKCRGENQSSNK